MSALICDICGGNLVMDETGEFARCESCGMKHSKERVKAKVQEVKGVVEVTKGEAEKERLLKNAETYIQLNEKLKAEEIYKQITNEYPDDWRGWLGLLKLEFEILQEVFPGRNDYKIKDYERKCIKLNPQSCEEIEKIYEKYVYKSYYDEPNKCFENFKEKIEKGELCFSELGLTGNEARRDIPNEVLEKISELLKNNANRVNDELKAKGKSYKLINIINIGKEPSGIDNRCKIVIKGSDIEDPDFKLREIIELKYLSTREATFKGKFEWGEMIIEKLKTIEFQTKYTIEELLIELMKPTYEEQRVIWKKERLCELCGAKLDNNDVCTKCQHIDEDLVDVKIEEMSKMCERFSDQYALYLELRDSFPQDKNVRYDCGGSLFEKAQYQEQYFVNIERKRDTIIIKVCYPEFVHGKYAYTSDYFGSQIYINIKLISKLIDFFKNRKITTVCQYCGGKFVGIFEKRCSECGRKKDY